MLNTPDLSQEFHPQPKVYKTKKVPKPLKQIGAKTEEWTKARIELKKLFATNGIMECQLKHKGCWGKNGLGFAHAKKRRKLDPSEIMQTILICNPCHETIERLPASEMENIVMDIIGKRGW